MLNTIYLALGFAALFVIAEFLRARRAVKVEYTRKLVHIGSGLLSLLFPIMIESIWAVFALCGSFAAILLISDKRGMLRSIHGIERKSHGSILYPAAVFGAFVFFATNHHADGSRHLIDFYLPVLILAICDPIAALVGGRWPIGRYRVGDGFKSISGSVVFLVSAFIVCYGLLVWDATSAAGTNQIVAALLLALLGTGAEAASPTGLDNLSIPASQIFGLLFIGHYIA